MRVLLDTHILLWWLKDDRKLSNVAANIIENSGPGVLNVTVNHACQISNLPSFHKDPFDRMLIAQSIVEPMRLLTHDETLMQYGKHVLLV